MTGKKDERGAPAELSDEEVAVDPRFDTLGGDTRFMNLVRRMGLAP